MSRNTGQIDHALEIEGPGVEDAKTPTIAPGASQELTVTLQDGKYELYCPIDGHKAQGMDLELQVGTGSGATTTETKTTGNGYSSGY